jgi:hypothetical protein
MMPIVPETLVEERIMADPEWIAGASWGVPRRGHPEGRVDAHVVEVLANVERVAVDRRDRERLRLIALVHDSLKHRVDRKRAREARVRGRS